MLVTQEISLKVFSLTFCLFAFMDYSIRREHYSIYDFEFSFAKIIQDSACNLFIPT